MTFSNTCIDSHTEPCAQKIAQVNNKNDPPPTRGAGIFLTCGFACRPCEDLYCKEFSERLLRRACNREGGGADLGTDKLSRFCFARKADLRQNPC